MRAHVVVETSISGLTRLQPRHHLCLHVLELFFQRLTLRNEALRLLPPDHASEFGQLAFDILFENLGVQLAVVGAWKLKINTGEIDFIF